MRACGFVKAAVFPEEGLFSKENALFWATGVLIVATAAVIIMKVIRKQRIPPFLLVSSSLIGVFGVLGIAFHSKLLLFLKPTIINLMFAGAIFGGLAVGRNIWKMLFNELFHLPDYAWRVLATIRRVSTRRTGFAYVSGYRAHSPSRRRNR